MSNEQDIGDLLQVAPKADPAPTEMNGKGAASKEAAVRKVIPRGANPARVKNMLRNYYAESRSKLSIRQLINAFDNLPNPTHGRVPISTKKLMRRDPTLYLGMSMLKAPLMTLEWWVDAESKDAKDAAALCEEVLRWYMPSLARLSLRAFDFGWQPFQVTWGFRDVKVENKNLDVSKTFRNALVPVRIMDLDPSEVLPLLDPETRDFMGVHIGGGLITTNTTEQRMIPREALFVVSNDPEYGDPRGWSLLDNAYKPWWAGEMVEWMALRYFERKGDPPIIARAPNIESTDPDTGETVDAQELARDTIYELRGSNVAVLPSDWDEFAKQYLYSIEYLADDKRGDMFSDFIQFIDHRKLMALGVPPKVLLPGNKVGTYAETKEQGGTFQGLLEAFLQNTLVEAINAQLVGPLTVLNFGAELKRPQFKTEGFTKTDLALIREVLKDFFAARHKIGDGKEGTGSQFVDIFRLMDRFGIPKVDPDEWEQPEDLEKMAAEAAMVKAKQGPAGAAGKPGGAGKSAPKRTGTSARSGEKKRNTLTE